MGLDTCKEITRGRRQCQSAQQGFENGWAQGLFFGCLASTKSRTRVRVNVPEELRVTRPPEGGTNGCLVAKKIRDRGPVGKRVRGLSPVSRRIRDRRLVAMKDQGQRLLARGSQSRWLAKRPKKCGAGQRGGGPRRKTIPYGPLRRKQFHGAQEIVGLPRTGAGACACQPEKRRR